MKTLDEAVALVYPAVPNKEGVRMEDHPETQRFVDRVQRYAPLLREVRGNSRVECLLMSLIQDVADDGMDVPSAMFTALCNGIIIGMEMEKP